MRERPVCSVEDNGVLLDAFEFAAARPFELRGIPRLRGARSG